MSVLQWSYFGREVRGGQGAVRLVEVASLSSPRRPCKEVGMGMQGGGHVKHRMVGGREILNRDQEHRGHQR